MQFFTIRDIEHLSGIKAHTLRIWEQRYSLIMPGRKESKHRQYTNEDLKQILKISSLYHQGIKISHIAAMSPEEIDERALAAAKAPHFDVFINQFVEAALDFDQERFEQIFRGLFLHLGFEKAMVHVVYPYLERLGSLWMTDNLLPAQEHFSSALVRKQIILDTEKIAVTPTPNTPKIVLFAPQGENHEIPLLLIANLLRKNGFGLAYFGVNISLDTLESYIALHPDAILYFHVITNFTDQEPEAYVERIRQKFPGYKIMASGPAVGELRKKWPDVRILQSLQELRLVKPGMEWEN